MINFEQCAVSLYIFTVSSLTLVIEFWATQIFLGALTPQLVHTGHKIFRLVVIYLILYYYKDSAY